MDIDKLTRILLADGDALDTLADILLARMKQRRQAPTLGLITTQLLTKQKDGSTRQETYTADGATEAAILELLTRAGTLPDTRLIPAVDLRAQLNTYFAEKGLRKGIETEMRRTIVWFLDYADKAALAPDSKLAAAGFKAELQSRNIKTKTLNNHLSRVSTFVSWCAAHGYLAENPIGGVKIKERKKHASKEERDQVPAALLSTFLGTCVAEVKHGDGRFWLPLILAHSGMRLIEATQLYVDDVQQEASSKIWFLRVDDKMPHQSLKTPTSRRRIPVHSKLLELGLLDHVDELRRAGEARLFGVWSLTGQSASKYAGNFLRSAMLDQCGRNPETGKPWTPHCIRHSCATALLDAPAARIWVVKALLGHAGLDGETNRYDKGRQLARLQELVEEAFTWL